MAEFVVHNILKIMLDLVLCMHIIDNPKYSIPSLRNRYSLEGYDYIGFMLLGYV